MNWDGLGRIWDCFGVFLVRVGIHRDGGALEWIT